ncbi:uncharacterized protein ACIBXB_005204 isoform 1-T1 [Morphnus guianensis]
MAQDHAGASGTAFWIPWRRWAKERGDPVEKYHVLESVLQGGDSRLQSNTETRLTAKVLGGHGGAQSRYISLQEKEKSKGSILPSKFCSRHQSARRPLWNWGL